MGYMWTLKERIQLELEFRSGRRSKNRTICLLSPIQLEQVPQGPHSVWGSGICLGTESKEVSGLQRAHATITLRVQIVNHKVFTQKP